MIITLNGDATDVPADTSLEALLVRSGHQVRRGLAIAMNGEVVPRGRWTEQCVSEGDVVELLAATQGG
ncbi:MAG TPA: sulfur carrier protein ThiS [Frankiaceae bacterium]|jgi:sulfur carrier protein|nr:sulfur carrier protein ThiS [Frankiaceae bacterium]